MGRLPPLESPKPAAFLQTRAKTSAGHEEIMQDLPMEKQPGHLENPAGASPSSRSAIPLSAAAAARAEIGVRAGFRTMSNLNLLSAAFNLVFPLLYFFVKLYIAQDLLLLSLISWKFLKSLENALAAGERNEGKVPCEGRNPNYSAYLINCHVANAFHAIPLPIFQDFGKVKKYMGAEISVIPKGKSSSMCDSASLSCIGMSSECLSSEFSSPSLPGQRITPHSSSLSSWEGKKPFYFRVLFAVFRRQARKAQKPFGSRATRGMRAKFSGAAQAMVML